MSDPYDIRCLDPADVVLSRGRGGVLRAVIDGTEYPEVALSRIFPLSIPKKYISVNKPDGEEIGIITDISQLGPSSLQELEAELRFRYLVPIVTRIDRIKQEPSLWIWDVQTDRGPMSLVMRNLHEHVQTVSQGRLMITDIDGRRCEIVQVDQLDAHSHKQLSKTS